MYQKVILILFLLNGRCIWAASVADSWILFAKAMKDSWSHCPVETGEWRCLKQSSIEVFDKMTKENVIPLAESVRLIRNQQQRKFSFDGDVVMDKNILERSSLSMESWSKHILKSILNLSKTHALSIAGTSSVEGRRRHNNNMMPMMILGLTSFGVFAVPLGFQFLLAVCGKAIMLSKMALLISSINGSRRVEHSDAHYGTYALDMHTHGHGYHYWNREDMEQPR